MRVRGPEAVEMSNVCGHVCPVLKNILVVDYFLSSKNIVTIHHAVMFQVLLTALRVGRREVRVGKKLTSGKMFVVLCF